MRILRVLKLLKELEQWKLIIHTASALFGPFYNLVMVMFTLFFLFATVADRLFGGLMTYNSPSLLNDPSVPSSYVDMNFNDYMSSFITLFHLMVVNNWFVTVNIYVGLSNGHKSVRIYFILFYISCVIIILNILVAYVIDMYASVDNLYNVNNSENIENNEK